MLKNIINTSAGVRELETPQIQVWGPYNRRSGGMEPQRSPGAEPLVRGQVREAKPPLKLKHFWLLDVHWKSQICPL